MLTEKEEENNNNKALTAEGRQVLAPVQWMCCTLPTEKVPALGNLMLYIIESANCYLKTVANVLEAAVSTEGQKKNTLDAGLSM